jgi:hypothetical protein
LGQFEPYWLKISGALFMTSPVNSLPGSSLNSLVGQNPFEEQNLSDLSMVEGQGVAENDDFADPLEFLQDDIDDGFVLVDGGEVQNNFLNLQALQLAQKWQGSIRGRLGAFQQVACDIALRCLSPFSVVRDSDWRDCAKTTVHKVIQILQENAPRGESVTQAVTSLHGVLTDISSKSPVDPVAISRQVVEVVSKVFHESNHPSKDVKYAMAVQSLKEVVAFRNYSREDNTLVLFNRALRGLKEDSQVRVLFSRLNELLDSERPFIVSPRDDYKEIIRILDHLSLLSEKTPFENPALEPIFTKLLKARWLGTSFGGHLEALVQLFTGEEGAISLQDASKRVTDLDISIGKADPRKVGKPLAALWAQCLEGELGVKYYTMENIPMVANTEQLSSGRELTRYRAGCPTVGGTYLNALLKIVYKTATANDQIAPNFRALVRRMGEQNEHILFTVHQTAVSKRFGDESERVALLHELSQEFPNFHIIIQSMSPRPGESYVVPEFKEGEKPARLLMDRLDTILKSGNPFTETGIHVPQICRDVDFKDHIYWIHQEIFDSQEQFGQNDWLAFMVIFYELQKLVIKDRLLSSGVNLVATTDPCKDDLDRGGTKWLTEMLLLGISTRQIQDPKFLNYVKSVFLGRPILVKKIGVHPRWAEPTGVILKKLTDPARFSTISRKIASLQKDPVVHLTFPQDSPQLYKEPRHTSGAEDLVRFWTFQKTLEKPLETCDLEEIFHGDYKRTSLEKDAPRIRVQIDGNGTLPSQQALNGIRDFFSTHVPVLVSDPKHNRYLEAICTQTLFSGKPVESLFALTPPETQYINQPVELQLRTGQRGVVQKVRYYAVSTKTSDHLDPAVVPPLVLEVFAPFDPSEGGYYRIYRDTEA